MFDIIIVNFKSKDYLQKCLQSVHAYLKDISANIYVVNNSSGNGIDHLKETYPTIHVINNPYNMGFSKAVNKVVKQSYSPFIVLLNPDAYIKDNFFNLVLNYMEKHPDVGILGPKILNLDGSLQGSARTFPTPFTAFFGRTSFLTRYFPSNRFSKSNILSHTCDGDAVMEVDWVSGACMIVRRSAIIAAGYLDERFFLYWEDADWCKRMWTAGWKVVYYQRASVVHYCGKSSDKLPVRSLFEFHKSAYRLFTKYARWPASILKPIAPFGLAVRIIVILSFHFGQRSWNLAKDFYRTSANCRPPGKIKILRIISRLNIGGPAIHVQQLVKGLDQERFESILVTGKISRFEGDMSYIFDPIAQKPLIVPELQRDLNPFKDIKTFIKILKLMMSERPDIVHTHAAKAGMTRLATFIYKKLLNKNVCVLHTFHGNVFEGYFSKAVSYLFILIERFFSSFTDVIVAISATQKKELFQKYRIAKEKKVKMVGLGFDLDPFFNNKLHRGGFRRAIGIDANTILIGMVGRIVPIKNNKLFIRAVRIFMDRHPDMDLKVAIVGDGLLRSELEAYCRELSLDQHVIFCGWIKDVTRVYADLDMLALTSLNEGTPVSIIEAMASGVPVIATDVGGVVDLLGKPSTLNTNRFKICERGGICRKNDAAGFSEGLTWMLDKKNQGDIQQMANHAQAYVREQYSVGRLINDIETLYLELYNSKCKGRPIETIMHNNAE